MHCRNVHIHEVLEERLIQLTNEHKLSYMSQLTKHLHIWPDFHGNRSPLSDPSLKGMVSAFCYPSLTQM